MVISGPYLDYGTKETVLTITKGIVDMNNNFIGVGAIDILVSDMQSVLQKVRFYDTGFLILVDETSGLVMNNPYGQSGLYHIYDQQITGLNNYHWDMILSRSNVDQILTITNTNNQIILIIRNFLSTDIPDQKYVLIIYVPEDEAFHFLCNYNA